MGRPLRSHLGAHKSSHLSADAEEQRPLSDSGRLLSLPQKRELEEAVLQPPLETQQDAQSSPTEASARPAELKCSEGSPGWSFCLF